MTETSNANTYPRKKMDPVRVYAGDELTPLLFWAATVSVVGFGVPVGWALGGLNTPVKILKDWCNQTLISTHHVVLPAAELELLWSLIISVFLIGGVVGGLTGAWFADRMGRKGTLFLGNTLNIIASVMFFVSKYIPSVDVFFMGRIVIGFSGGLLMTVVPMYMNEISPHRLAGSMGTLFCPGITLGIMISQILGTTHLLGTPTRWPYLVSGSLVCSVFVFVVLPFLPESPKFLNSVRHERERALDELARLRNMPRDLVAWEIRSDDSGRVREKWSLIKVLSTPRLRLPLFLVVAMQAGQQLAGINAVFFYSYSIFEAAGLEGVSIQYANIGTGIINCVVVSSSLWLVKTFRRRTLILTSTGLSVISLIFLTLFCKFMDDARWIQIASVVAVLAFVFFYGLGLGPIPYFIGAELVDIGPRPTIMALGSVANWGGNFAVGTSFPTMKNLLGENAFLIFIGFTILLFIFLYLYLPETSRLHEHALSINGESDERDEDDPRTGAETDQEHINQEPNVEVRILCGT